MQLDARDKVQKDPLEEGLATTAVFFPGESNGQRSLTGGLWSIGSQRVSQTGLK